MRIYQFFFIFFHIAAFNVSLLASNGNSINKISEYTSRFVPDSVGIHPVILFNENKIERIKLAIELREEPFYSASIYLFSYCNARLNYAPVPYTGNDSHEYYTRTLLPASVVRNMALAYQLSGNVAYGEKAVELIKQYATALSGKLLSKTIDFPNQSMKLARASFPFVCAYDLMLNSGLLDNETKSQVNTWFREIEMQVKEGEQVWEANDYFSKQYYNNHLVAHTLSLLAIGAALDDQSLIQYAIESQSCPRDVIDLIEGMILMEGDEDCVRVKNLPKENGEIIDRFRHFTAPRKGLQYASLVLNLFSPIGLICDHLGWNLFDYTAPTGENLQLSYNYYSDFWRTKDSSIKSGYYTGENARLEAPADFIGNFEVGLAYYPNSQQLQDVVASYNRAIQHIDLLGFTAFFAKPELAQSNTNQVNANSALVQIHYNGEAVVVENNSNVGGKLMIYNATGQLMRNYCFSETGKIEFFSKFNPGIYISKVSTTDGNTYSAKVYIW